MSQATVLYEVPGPRGRRRNRLLTVVFTVVFAAIAAWVVWALGQKDQWAAQKWKPFLQGDIWTVQIIPGLVGTLKAAAIAAVLALAFGMVFGLTMYNGSVLAEVVRAGINAIPKGQSEAGYAIGLRRGQLMRLVLVPQAITAMMP